MSGRAWVLPHLVESTPIRPAGSTKLFFQERQAWRPRLSAVRVKFSESSHTRPYGLLLSQAALKHENGSKFSTLKKQSQKHRLHIVCRAQNPSEEQFEFQQRLETVWGINKQPPPIPCESCRGEGENECPWCKGTGFFVLGDNLLCEIPSKNTTCRICTGTGTTPCDKCRGTGFRAQWIAFNQWLP